MWIFTQQSDTLPDSIYNYHKLNRNSTWVSSLINNPHTE